jgi:DNA invertase Pin-like site-specific DNA recombinase
MRLLQYVRLDKRDPEGAEQRAVISSFAPPGEWTAAEYVEAVRREIGTYPQRDKLVRAVRSSADMIVVADFWRLASRLGDLTDAIAIIRAKHKPVIVEARTGKRSDCQRDLAEMVARASHIYSGRLLTPDNASAAGKKGAEASPATKPKEGRAPWKVIVEQLREMRTVDEAVQAVNEMGYETPINRIWLYREVKKRGKDLKTIRAKRPAKK